MCMNGYDKVEDRIRKTWESRGNKCYSIVTKFKAIFIHGTKERP